MTEKQGTISSDRIMYNEGYVWAKARLLEGVLHEKVEETIKYPQAGEPTIDPAFAKGAMSALKLWKARLEGGKWPQVEVDAKARNATRGAK